MANKEKFKFLIGLTISTILAIIFAICFLAYLFTLGTALTS